MLACLSPSPPGVCSGTNAASGAGAEKLNCISAATQHYYAAYIWDLIGRLRQLNLDVNEYTFLKALLLFRPGMYLDESRTISPGQYPPGQYLPGQCILMT